MPSIANKAYDVLLIVLKQLADGIVKHSATNSEIRSSLRESELREVKAELELLREKYLQSEKETRKAYNEFGVKLKTAQELAGNKIRIIKGILGPKSTDLNDFGILPEKSKTAKTRMTLSKNKS